MKAGLATVLVMFAAVAAGLSASAGVGASAAASASAATTPGVNWSRYLPALPSGTETQPSPVPHCRRASLRCIRTELRRLRRAERQFGCDHRAVFATTYKVLTRVLLRTLQKRPRFFRRPRYLFREDAQFANIYFRTLRRWQHGRPVPPAWRISLRAAASGQVNAGQDMLLGINAHVQNDMPFLLASLGLRTPSGESRKPDHDRMNRVLRRAYEPVVRAVRRRYDPLVSLTNSSWSPIDDVAGLEVVRSWREGVWRNAERLVNARSHAARRRVARQIKQNAAAWARTIATPEQPGYRAQRDAYCRARLGR